MPRRPAPVFDAETAAGIEAGVARQVLEFQAMRELEAQPGAVVDGVLYQASDARQARAAATEADLTTVSQALATYAQPLGWLNISVGGARYSTASGSLPDNPKEGWKRGDPPLPTVHQMTRNHSGIGPTLYYHRFSGVPAFDAPQTAGEWQAESSSDSASAADRDDFRRELPELISRLGLALTREADPQLRREATEVLSALEGGLITKPELRALTEISAPRPVPAAESAALRRLALDSGYRIDPTTWLALASVSRRAAETRALVLAAAEALAETITQRATPGASCRVAGKKYTVQRTEKATRLIEGRATDLLREARSGTGGSLSHLMYNAGPILEGLGVARELRSRQNSLAVAEARQLL